MLAKWLGPYKTSVGTPKAQPLTTCSFYNGPSTAVGRGYRQEWYGMSPTALERGCARVIENHDGVALSALLVVKSSQVPAPRALVTPIWWSPGSVRLA